MCANHAKCNPEGRCDWTGDYGSYQEHIRACQNIPTRCDLSSTATEQVGSVVVAPERLEGCDELKVGIKAEAPDYVDEVNSVSSETTTEPISIDASEASEASDSDEAKDGFEELSEATTSSESAPVEASKLNELISELVGLKLKEHQQYCEVQDTPVVADSHDDDSSHARFVTQVSLDEATSPSSKKSASKKSKKAKQNQEAAPSNAALRQAAQMAYWQAAQMAQWRQLQAAQVAHWQAAQVRAARLQAAQVQQWRMAQAAWAAQCN